jgi:hypothetical protein
MIYARHVYADASQITPEFAAIKRGFSCRSGARFGSVAFVTDEFDPCSEVNAR